MYIICSFGNSSSQLLIHQQYEYKERFNATQRHANAIKESPDSRPKQVETAHYCHRVKRTFYKTADNYF